MLTAGTFLLYQTANGSYTFGQATTKWDILYPISEYPDLDAEIDAEDNTTLSNAQHTYEPALPDSGGSLDFSGYFYDEDFARVDALADEVCHIGVSFGGTTQADKVTIIPTGGTLMMDCNARVRIRKTGAGVGDIRPVTVSIYPTFDEATYPA